MELAARGHDIHFISIAPPIRMNPNDPRIHFHEVEVASYPLFDHPPYTLALAKKCSKFSNPRRWTFARTHYAIPHSVSPARAFHGRRRDIFPHHHASRHGHHLVGTTAVISPSPSFPSSRVTASPPFSRYLFNQDSQEFDSKRPSKSSPIL